jgi:hypothetical protein
MLKGIVADADGNSGIGADSEVGLLIWATHPRWDCGRCRPWEVPELYYEAVRAALVLRSETVPYLYVAAKLPLRRTDAPAIRCLHVDTSWCRLVPRDVSWCLVVPRVSSHFFAVAAVQMGPPLSTSRHPHRFTL